MVDKSKTTEKLTTDSNNGLLVFAYNSCYYIVIKNEVRTYENKRRYF